MVGCSAFYNDKKYNPVDDIINDIDVLGKDAQSVSFPVFLKMGRV